MRVNGNGHGNGNGTYQKMLAVRVERRTIAVAALSGTRLEGRRVLQLSGTAARAEASTLRDFPRLDRAGPLWQNSRLSFPPFDEIRRHGHWTCFQARGSDWFKVHMEQP